MFTSQVSLLEIVARVLLVYAGLFVLVRLSGKREIGQLGPMDLLAMLILSETVGPSLTGSDSSIPAAWTAAATLLLTGTALQWLSHRSRRAERLIEGRPLVIIEKGHVLRAQMDRLRITEQELGAALRAVGLESPAGVRLAVVETTGHISVLRDS